MTAPADPRPVLLLTRPQTASQRFARAFRMRFGADWPVLIAPLTAIRPTGAEVPDAPALIFTSEQAVGLVPRAGGRVAYCVGPRTAGVARAAGFRAITAGGDADALVALIRARHRDGALVHARGAEAASPVAQILAADGFAASEVVVYQQETLPLTCAVIALFAQDGVVMAPVFSPRSGERLVRAVPDRHARLWLAPISAAAAHACAPLAAQRMEIAPAPDAEGILVALSRLAGNELSRTDAPARDSG